MNPTILVVEDEPAIQDLIQINLEMGGYRVLTYDSAESALKQVQLELPDLALLDWMLPGMSGVELARRLRADSRTKSLPIILLTAKGEEEDKLKGLESGADDYMTKPFSVRELEARIKAVLRRRAPELTQDVIEYHGLRLDPTSHKISGHGSALSMGPTEFRLLHFFMTHIERVYSRTSYSILYGAIMCLSRSARWMSTSGGCVQPYRLPSTMRWCIPCVAAATGLQSTDQPGDKVASCDEGRHQMVQYRATL